MQVDTRTATFWGTTKIYGELDFADALDLDAALNRRAAALADAGSTQSLDIRRAVALGDLARGQDGIDGLDVTPGVTREVVLHVHTTPEAVEANTGPSNIAKLCRSHHRLKTHSGWTYHCLEPGTYLWRSPRGLTLRRGPQGSSHLE